MRGTRFSIFMLDGLNRAQRLQQWPCVHAAVCLACAKQILGPAPGSPLNAHVERKGGESDQHVPPSKHSVPLASSGTGSASVIRQTSPGLRLHTSSTRRRPWMIK